MAFGDDDPADAYDASELPDPIQVARRLHEARAYLEAVHGRPFPAWHRLPADHRDLAVALALDLLEWLELEGHL